MTQLITILDDEEDILELVSVNLKKSGFKTKEFTEAKPFLKYLENNLPDLIILDLMLPDLDGLDICKIIKANSKTNAIPVIMLTARTDETDKIVGLELGADDYVTKPFSPKELIARVKAVLRRSGKKQAETKKIQINKNVYIDTEKYELYVDNIKIEITTTEFKILQILAEKRGVVFSREKILDFLWGNEKAVIDRTIDVHIKHLREKLGKYAGIIKNIRGVGYKIET